MRLPLVALILIGPAFAGCFADDAAPSEDDGVAAASLEDAGATNGPAPVAAKKPFKVAADPNAPPSSSTTPARSEVAYPVAMPSSKARAPITREFTGEFGPTDCSPTGGIPLGGAGTSNSRQVHSIADDLQGGDVFTWNVTMTFSNTDASWGDLHLFVAMGAARAQNTDSTAQARGEYVIGFEGQSYRVSDTSAAWVNAMCWYGAATTPIPYKVEVRLTFAEEAVPSATPVLVTVPDNATKLFITGVAVDGSKPVTSHVRVFRPDDKMLCECALLSNQKTATIDLPEPGDYVLIVDHTDNGFVSFALNAPSVGDLVPLENAWVTHEIASSDGGPASGTVTIDLPSTPLMMSAWVLPPAANQADGGFGRNVNIDITNARGEVMRFGLGAYVTFQASTPTTSTTEWYPLPVDGDWEFYVDHHAYGPGEHSVTYAAEALRGTAVLFVNSYVRP